MRPPASGRGPYEWAARVGEGVVPAPDRAVSLREGVRRLAQVGGKDTDKRIADLLEEALTLAYDAGVREGRSAERAQLAAVIQERVRAAVASIAVEPARCPHCLGRGCEPCGMTGNRT